MDALMAALVAAALAQAGDRTPLLAAVLADRYRAAPVLLAAMLALTAGHALAAMGGDLVAPMLTPKARQALLALALIFASGSALLLGGKLDRLAGWRVGAFATSFLGVLILAFGDSAQFITAALSARSDAPALATIGATIGSLVAVVPAILLGEAGWRRLPLTAIRLGGAALFLIFGVVIGLGAASLI